MQCTMCMHVAKKERGTQTTRTDDGFVLEVVVVALNCNSMVGCMVRVAGTDSRIDAMGDGCSTTARTEGVEYSNWSCWSHAPLDCLVVHRALFHVALYHRYCLYYFFYFFCLVVFEACHGDREKH